MAKIRHTLSEPLMQNFMTSLAGLTGCILQLEGHFVDPARSAEAKVSTCFLLRNPLLAPLTLIITNAHCVGSELNLIEVVSYQSGRRAVLGTLLPPEFASDPIADLAVAIVNNDAIATLAYPWKLPPIGEEVKDGDQVASFGYPKNDADFIAIRGPSATYGTVKQGSTDFHPRGQSFFTDGAWGEGRSGSPVYALGSNQAVLLGVNRGTIDAAQQPDGSWSDYGWSDIASVDILWPLLSRITPNDMPARLLITLTATTQMKNS